MDFVTYKDVRMPALGFGTWKLDGKECVQAIQKAFEIGYRHIDTAQAYGNEDAVGEAIKSVGIPRDEIFLTTKIWMDNVRDGDVQSSLDESLSLLKTDYVDLLLVHWPVESVPFEETMKAFRDVQEQNKTKLIGVSNFTVVQMKQLREEIGADVAVNQVEYHPTLSQEPVLDYIRSQNMILTAYSPLGRGEEVENETVKQIAGQHGKTPGQILLRWLIQQERVAAIPKAGSENHIRENFEIFDFELSDAEMQKLHGLANPNGRIIDPEWAPEWDTARAA